MEGGRAGRIDTATQNVVALAGTEQETTFGDLGFWVGSRGRQL